MLMILNHAVVVSVEVQDLNPITTVPADVQSPHDTIPDSKVHGANMGPIWGRQDPGGPHVGPMNFGKWNRNHDSC